MSKVLVMKIAMLPFAHLAQAQQLTYPGYRYIPFTSLSDERKDAAYVLQYSDASWDLPGTNKLEYLCFECLTLDQQEAAKVIGFPIETYDGDDVEYSDTWDCYVNHYYDFSWETLVSYDVAQYYETLGYDEEYWNSTDPNLEPPLVESLLWDELQPNQREAAGMLCYSQQTWDMEETIDSWSADFRGDWCEDSTMRLKVFKDGKIIARYCEWVARKSTTERCALSGVAETCPRSCGVCAKLGCVDSPLRFNFAKDGKRIARSCEWVGRIPELTVNRCAIDGMTETCKATCDYCE